MNLPDGFDPDPTSWLETSFAFDAVLECHPIIGRQTMAAPAHWDAFGLNIYAPLDHPVCVSECLNPAAARALVNDNQRAEADVVTPKRDTRERRMMTPTEDMASPSEQ
jgi:hypothetical protein